MTADLTSFNALPEFQQTITKAVSAFIARVGFFMDRPRLIRALSHAAEMHVLKGRQMPEALEVITLILSVSNAVNTASLMAEVNNDLAARFLKAQPCAEEIEAMIEEVDEFEGVTPHDVAPALALTTPAGVIATPFGWMPEALPPVKPLFINTTEGSLDDVVMPPVVTAKPSPEPSPSEVTGEFDALPLPAEPALSFDETMLSIAPAYRVEGSPCVFVRSRTTAGKVYSVAGGRSCSCPATRSCWHQQAAKFAQRWEDAARGFHTVGLSPRQIAAMWRGMEAKHGRDVVGAMIEFIDG